MVHIYIYIYIYITACIADRSEGFLYCLYRDYYINYVLGDFVPKWSRINSKFICVVKFLMAGAVTINSWWTKTAFLEKIKQIPKCNFHEND